VWSASRPQDPAVVTGLLERILEAAAAAGARTGGYLLLRLPHEVEPLFTEWLHANYPTKAGKVLDRLREMRGGRMNDPRFATLDGRIQNALALDARVAEWTADREPYAVMAAMQSAGIAAGVVQNVEDQVERDPQLAARRFFEEIEHLALGTVVATGIPLGLTGTPGRSGRSGAAIGEDNDRVFGELHLVAGRAQVQTE